MQVLGDLPGDLRVRRGGAVAVGRVAGGAGLGQGLRASCACAGAASATAAPAAQTMPYHRGSGVESKARFYLNIPQAQFLASVGRAAELPPPGPPEVAFAGRSNVGKSSAINAILGRKRLAFTSKTPGRTQTINFYDLAGAARLVDLPGYGFARVPQAVRAQWQALVGAYLDSRATLAGVVVVMDARHPFPRSMNSYCDISRIRRAWCCCRKRTSSRAPNRPRSGRNSATRFFSRALPDRGRRLATCWSNGSSRPRK